MAKKRPVGNIIFRFEKMGDKLKGTYIGKYTIKNTLMNNAEVNVYQIRRRGKVIGLFGKPTIDFQMKNIQFGQIVKFQYTTDAPPKGPGYQPVRIIDVFADVKNVDGPFLLEENKRLKDQIEWVKNLVGVSKKKIRKARLKLQD